jgi:hypothetical protein
VSSAYHEGSRALQDRFDARRLADRLEERFLSRGIIGPEDRAFIERMDMFFLATADAEGRPQCSYKGGAPGFVCVLDEHTLQFPNYDGNGMFLSTGNVRVNPNVGMLFIDFVSRRPSRMALVERSRFVPQEGIDPPVPDWKRTEWACDVLPAGDPAATQ